MKDRQIGVISNPFATSGLARCKTISAFLGSAMLLCGASAFSQTPLVVWAQQVSGVYNSSLEGTLSCVAADKNGNMFFAGSFATTTVSVGNQILTNSSVDPARNDSFIAKYSSAGDLRWIRQIGGAGSETASAAAVDSDGDLVVALLTVSSNITVGTNILSSNGTNDILLAKYDPAGNLLWASLIAGSGIAVYPSLAADPSGNSFLAGTYTGTNLMIGSNSLTKSNSSIGEDFLAKFDPFGNALWAKQIPISVTASNLPLVAADGQGNVYLYESYETVANFGNVTVTNAISNAKYDQNGNLLWVRTVAAPGGAELTSVAADSQGNTYFTGYGVPQLQGVSLPFGVAFVAESDNSGNVIWGNSITGDYYLALATKSVAVDLLGNCYVMGGTGSTITGFGSISLTNADKNGFFPIGHGFVAKYSPSGNVLWARLLATPGVNNSGNGAVDSQGNIYYGGSATGTNFLTLDGIIVPTPTNGNYLYYYFAAKISGPALSIQSAGGNVVISWPTNAAGLNLESSADLSSGAWSPVTNTPGIVGEQFTVTNSISGTSRYYRLRNF